MIVDHWIRSRGLFRILLSVLSDSLINKGPMLRFCIASSHSGGPFLVEIIPPNGQNGNGTWKRFFWGFFLSKHPQRFTTLLRYYWIILINRIIILYPHPIIRKNAPQFPLRYIQQYNLLVETTQPYFHTISSWSYYTSIFLTYEPQHNLSRPLLLILWWPSFHSKSHDLKRLQLALF